MFQNLFDIILSCQSKFDCYIQCPPWNLGIFFSLFCLWFYFFTSFVLTCWPFFVSQPIFHATHCAPLLFQSIGHALNSYPFAMHQENVLQSRPFGLIPQNTTEVASMCLPLLPTPLVALELQMDHMMPFQSHHPNGLPFALGMQHFHPWPHLCLRFHKGDFAPMGIIEVDRQP